MDAVIPWNPLETLRTDAEVRHLFSQVVHQRLDTRILAGHFGLPSAPDEVILPQGKVPLLDFVDRIVAFLVDSAHLAPAEVARRFGAQFRLEGAAHPAVPATLHPTLNRYFEKKEEMTDVEMVRDLIDERFLKLGAIADIGCGTNRLGSALLKLSDGESKSLKQVYGTDVRRYGGSGNDSRVCFLGQFGTRLPLSGCSVDLAIAKWALHHMTKGEIEAQAHEISRILRPGGRAVVIEALVGSAHDTRPLLEAEQQDRRTWPTGEWWARRAGVTDAYLRLSEDQQIKLLALQDYYGHWLEEELPFMPLPFNYMSLRRWSEIFARAGLVLDTGQTRVFGMAPIIHWGPPSIRAVFEKHDGAVRWWQGFESLSGSAMAGTMPSPERVHPVQRPIMARAKTVRRGRAIPAPATKATIEVGRSL